MLLFPKGGASAPPLVNGVRCPASEVEHRASASIVQRDFTGRELMVRVMNWLSLRRLKVWVGG